MPSSFTHLLPLAVLRLRIRSRRSRGGYIGGLQDFLAIAQTEVSGEYGVENGKERVETGYVVFAVLAAALVGETDGGNGGAAATEELFGMVRLAIAACRVAVWRDVRALVHSARPDEGLLIPGHDRFGSGPMIVRVVLVALDSIVHLASAAGWEDQVWTALEEGVAEWLGLLVRSADTCRSGDSLIRFLVALLGDVTGGKGRLSSTTIQMSRLTGQEGNPGDKIDVRFCPDGSIGHTRAISLLVSLIVRGWRESGIKQGRVSVAAAISSWTSRIARRRLGDERVVMKAIQIINHLVFPSGKPGGDSSRQTEFRSGNEHEKDSTDDEYPDDNILTLARVNLSDHGSAVAGVVCRHLVAATKSACAAAVATRRPSAVAHAASLFLSLVELARVDRVWRAVVADAAVPGLGPISELIGCDGGTDVDFDVEPSLEIGKRLRQLIPTDDMSDCKGKEPATKRVRPGLSESTNQSNAHNDSSAVISAVFGPLNLFFSVSLPDEDVATAVRHFVDMTAGTEQEADLSRWFDAVVVAVSTLVLPKLSFTPVDSGPPKEDDRRLVRVLLASLNEAVGVARFGRCVDARVRAAVAAGRIAAMAGHIAVFEADDDDGGSADDGQSDYGDTDEDLGFCTQIPLPTDPVLASTPPSDTLGIGSLEQMTPLTAFVLRTANSTVREVRLASIMALDGYLAARPANRDVLVEYLTMVESKHRDGDANHSASHDGMLEAAVVGWGLLARSCRTVLIRFSSGEVNADEGIAAEAVLATCLVRLAGHLAGPNVYLSALAATEVKAVARAGDEPVDQLLRPFRSEVMLSLVQTALSADSFERCTSRLAGLAGWSADQLLADVQVDIVPVLVVNGDRTMLERVARARANVSGLPTSIREVCLRPARVLGAVLAALLVRLVNAGTDFAEIGPAVVAAFSRVATEFESLSLNEMVRIEYAATASELLRMISSGTPGAETAKSALQALALVVAVESGKKPAPLPSGRVETLIVEFCGRNLLGLVSSPAYVIGSIPGAFSVKARVCAVSSIGELVRLAAGRVAAAIPQIRASVDAAAAAGLVDSAVGAWAVLVRQFLPEDGAEDGIRTVVDHSFALVAELWCRLGPDGRTSAVEMLRHLGATHPSVVAARARKLAELPPSALLSKIRADVTQLGAGRERADQLDDLVERTQDASGAVVERGLRELSVWLGSAGAVDWLAEVVMGASPASFVGSTLVDDLIRSLLGAGLRFSGARREEVGRLAAKALGRIGAVDPARIAGLRDRKETVVASDFVDRDECIGWVGVLLSDVLVTAFRSAANGRAQNYVALAMQELMRWAGFDQLRRGRPGDAATATWEGLAEDVKSTVAPYLESRFFLAAPPAVVAPVRYPIFAGRVTAAVWVRVFARDLIYRVGQVKTGDDGDQNDGSADKGYADKLFGIVGPIMRWQDSSIAAFVLPYAVVHAVAAGDDTIRADVATELSAVLAGTDNAAERAKAGGHVFRVLDYLSRFRLARGRSISESDQAVVRVSDLLAAIPSAVLADRAMEWNEHARALFHSERPVTAETPLSDDERARLALIYRHLGEQDALDGLIAATDWADPDAATTVAPASTANPALATVSSWTDAAADPEDDSFAPGLARAVRLLSLSRTQESAAVVADLRSTAAAGLTPARTASVAGSAPILRRLHFIAEVEDGGSAARLGTSGIAIVAPDDQLAILAVRSAVLEAREASPVDRAAVVLAAARIARKAGLDGLASGHVATATSLIGSAATVEIERAKGAWAVGDDRRAMAIVRRIGRPTPDAQPVAAVIANPKAKSGLGAGATADSQDAESSFQSARARLLLAKWIDRAESRPADDVVEAYRAASASFGRWEKGHFHLGRFYDKQRALEAELPTSQQSAAFIDGDLSRLVVANYTKAAMFGAKHAATTIPRTITVWLDLAALVAPVGRKHPAADGVGKIHTFLLKYGPHIPPVVMFTGLSQLLSRIGMAGSDVRRIATSLIGRVVRTYPRQALWSVLAVAKSSVAEKKDHARQIVNVVRSQPNRSSISPRQPSGAGGADQLSSFIAATTRLTDALIIACDAPVPARAPTVSLSQTLRVDLSRLVPSFVVVPVEATLTPAIPTVFPTAAVTGAGGTGSDLSDQPASSDMPSSAAASHPPVPPPPFPSPVLIAGVEDQVTVLTSLQRPRRLTFRGSDGRLYPLLAKPRDDLRLDQRTMEFIRLVKRALRSDTSARRRGLSIISNAITPLNEACGLIEWLPDVRPLRDILFRCYQRRGIRMDFEKVRVLLAQASESISNSHIFTDTIIPMFPPILASYYTETFPSPPAWLSARSAFARSSAVMSVVGHIIGLGDRHGENVLIETRTGAVVHVDFNCLFDKGATFQKPELVPFRLTHNMASACGPFSVEGVWKKAAEITSIVARTKREELVAVLETFVHDPAVGMITPVKKSKKTGGSNNIHSKLQIQGSDGKSTSSTSITVLVPPYPAPGSNGGDPVQDILRAVRDKLSGRMSGQAVPLGPAGWVDALVGMAVDPARLANMYIGWCSFL